MHQNNVVDIIIPTRNRGGLIDTTIRSIRASTMQELTLWVVDQSDGDATELCVQQHMAEDARVRYLRTTTRGISAARNVGISASDASIILFTDDDCRVAPEWAAALACELGEDGACAAFGRILPDQTHLADPIGAIIPLAVKPAVDRAVYVDNRLDLSFGHGANMGIRRACITEVHGFDELLGVGGKLSSWEDRDFGYRVLRQGGRIVYTPAAEVYHRQWRDWREVRKTQRDYALGAGAAAGKYIRCGDSLGWLLLGEWLFSQGARQIVSGALKWRSAQKIMVGVQNLIYPWLGMARGMRYAVDREYLLYRL